MRRQLLAGLVRLGTAAGLALLVCAAQADQARYYYDGLGRLIGVVDGQGNVAVYEYDRVGNLRSISHGTATAPAVTEVSPSILDAGGSASLTLTGSGLFFATVATSHPEMALGRPSSTGTSVTVPVTLPNPTSLGPTTLTLTAPGGTTAVTVTVRQPTPVIAALAPGTGNAALVGTPVILEGNGFGTKPGSNRVTFAGLAGARVTAPVLAESGTRITARVPAGALPGPVTVEVGGLTSAGFPSQIDTVGPAVAAVLPADGQSFVPLNARVTLLFDEPVDPATVTRDTFFVGSVSIVRLAGTIAVAPDGLSATFTPDQPFIPNAAHSVTVGTGFGQVVRDQAGNPLRNPGTTSFTTGAVADAAPPTVRSLTPAPGSEHVPTNAVIRVQFSEALAPPTVTAQHLQLSTGGAPVPLTLVLEQGNTVVRLVPTAGALLPGTVYHLTVAAGLTDLAGNPLAAGAAATFTTGAGADAAPPAVVSVLPPDGATNVPLSTTIEVTFSEPIQPASVNAATTFTLTGGGVSGPIPGGFAFSADQRVVTFTPNFPLFAAQTFFVTLSGIEDAAGNRIADTGSAFTTEVGSGPSVVPTLAAAFPTDSILYANGKTTAKIRIPYVLDADGALVPDGTLVAVTAEPIFDLSTAGGTIFGGTASAADPRVRVFATKGGGLSTEVTYRAPALTLPPGSVVRGIVQIMSVTATGVPISLIGTAQVSLVTSTTATIALNPDTLLPDGASRSDLSVLVRDTFGRPVPPETPIIAGVFADQFNQGRPLGTLGGGTATTEPRLRLYRTKPGGAAEFPYTAPSLTLAPDESAMDTIAVFPSDEAGNITSPFLSSFANGLLRLKTGGCVTEGNETGCIPPGFRGPLPTILGLSPADGQTAVGTNAVVTALFSQSLDPATVTAATVGVASGAGTVAGSLALSGSALGPNTVVTFTPSQPLAPASVYSVTITTGVKSAVGSPLPAAGFATFATGDGADATPPSVLRLNPGDALAAVPTNVLVSVELSEPVNAATLTAATFALSAGGTPVPGRVTAGLGDRGPNTILTFIPDQLLAPNQAYTVTLGAGLTDTAGHPLPATFTASFTTVAEAPLMDTAAPVIVAGSPSCLPFNITSSPCSAIQNVPLDAKLVFRFDERLNPLSLVEGAVQLFDGNGNLVPGTLSLSADQTTVTFTPAQPLEPGLLYVEPLIGQQVTDLAGNSVGFQFLDRFVTGAAASDPAGPRVLSVTPADGEAGVPLNQPITIRFSEPIAPTSLTDQAILVSRGGTPVAGTVRFEQDTTLNTEANLTIVQWRPSTPAQLAGHAAHTVTVTTALANLALRPLGAPVGSAFTTGTAADTTPPAIAATSPADGATGVPRTTAIEVTFDESVSPLGTRLSLSFPLLDYYGGAPIAGVAAFSPDRRTLAFTPQFPLFANQTYSVSVTVVDPVGNRAVPPPFRFTTALAPGTILGTLPVCCVGVTPEQAFLPPDGATTTLVTLSGISTPAGPAPDGTLVGVAVESVFFASDGGTILGGSVSGADPRVTLFATSGGQVTFTYQPPLRSSDGHVRIQVFSVDAAGAPIELIGDGFIGLSGSGEGPPQ